MGHQTTILENLIPFLELRYDEYYTKQGKPIPKEFSQVIEILRKGGHCFSFSLTLGAMAEIGQLIWWGYALECLETWDKDPASLQQKISERKGFEQLPPKEKEALKNLSLHDLFVRSVDYIIFHQAAIQPPLLPEGLSQQDLLKPDSHLFEIVNSKGEILSIKDRTIPAIGHLSLSEMESLLNEDTPAICLAYSLGHAVRIGVHKNQWLVYDPNYERDDSKPSGFKYLRYFPSKQEAINEVFRILGHDIVLEIASTSKTISPPTLTLATDEQRIKFIWKNINPTVLQLFVIYHPSLLIQLTALLDRNNFPDAVQHLAANFADTLIMRNRCDYTGLSLTARYAPEALSHLIQYLRQNNSPVSQKLKTNFAQALATKRIDDGWTGLHTIARYAPQLLIQLITYMYKDNSANNTLFLKMAFANALAHQAADKGGSTTGLHLIAQYAPEALTLLMQYLDVDDLPNNPCIRIAFAGALLKKNQRGFTALDKIPLTAYYISTLIKLAPHTLTQLMIYLRANPELLEANVNALSLREQLAADAFFLVHNNAISPPYLELIWDTLVGAPLNDCSIQKIALTFADAQVQAMFKTWIYQEMLTHELRKRSPDVGFILSALSQGRSVWSRRFNQLPYYSPQGQPIYLSLIEQAIACSYFAKCPELFKKAFQESKKENIVIDAQRIADSYPASENEIIFKQITLNLIQLDPEQTLINELQRGIYADQNLIVEILSRQSTKINWDIALPNSKLTLAEAVIAQAFVNQDFLRPEQLEIILNTLGNRLDGAAIGKIIKSFSHAKTQTKVKEWIHSLSAGMNNKPKTSHPKFFDQKFGNPELASQTNKPFGPF